MRAAQTSAAIDTQVCGRLLASGVEVTSPQDVVLAAARTGQYGIGRTDTMTLTSHSRSLKIKIVI